MKISEIFPDVNGFLGAPIDQRAWAVVSAAGGLTAKSLHLGNLLNPNTHLVRDGYSAQHHASVEASVIAAFNWLKAQSYLSPQNSSPDFLQLSPQGKEWYNNHPLTLSQKLARLLPFFRGRSVTNELITLLGHAQFITERFEKGAGWSFGSLILAFLVAEYAPGNTSLCEWFQDYIAGTAIDPNSIARALTSSSVRGVTKAAVSFRDMKKDGITGADARALLLGKREIRWHRSVQAMFEEAAGLARRTAPEGAPLDTRHIMGALIYKPNQDTLDLEEWGFDRIDWSEAFLAWLNLHFRGEFTQWATVHFEVFRQSPTLPRSVPSKQKVLQDTPAGQGSVRPSPKESTADNGVKESKGSAEKDRSSDPYGPIEVAVRALSDKPSAIDLLQFGDYADALADFIRNERTEKPLTIGIDGSWGAGKTTLMEMVRDRLAPIVGNNRDKEKIRTVWFNAWKYDEQESVWAALALEILSQVRKQSTRCQRVRLWFKLNLKRFDTANFLKRLARATIYPLTLVLVCLAEVWALHHWMHLKVDAFRVSTFIASAGVLGASFMIAREVRDELVTPFDLGISGYLRKPDYRARLGFITEFEDDFKLVIDAVTESGKWPLTVFIDDLDRCEPPKPAEIIEAVNLLLDSKHCVFVIGMDTQAIAASIEAKYGKVAQNFVGRDKAGGLTMGQRFIEKIIQIHFRIPTATQEVLATFADEHLSKDGRPPKVLSEVQVVEVEKLIEAEQRQGKSVKQAAETVRADMPEIPQQVVSAAEKNVYAKSFDDDPDARSAIHKMIPFLQSNPRKIKRFINSLRLQALIANRRGLFENGLIRMDRLAVWAAIAMCWPEVIPLLSEPGFVKRLREARRLHEAPFHGQGVDNTEKSTIALAPYLEDDRIRRLVKSHNLFTLLEIAFPPNSDLESCSAYLRLAGLNGESQEPGPAV